MVLPTLTISPTVLNCLLLRTLSGKSDQILGVVTFLRPEISPSFFTPDQTFPRLFLSTTKIFTRLFCPRPILLRDPKFSTLYNWNCDGAVANDEPCDDFDEDDASTEVID